MGTALGAAAVLPALESLLIFIFLGLGLASPFLLVAVSPQARKIIPKPGAWMDKLKQFFAFPLVATVIWLLWVLHLQVGIDALPLSMGALLLLTFAFWWKNNFRRGFFLFALIAVLALIYVGRDFNSRAASASSESLVTWEAFSPAKVQAARAEGKSVFIDFTAAWCITCQFNKKTVLRTTAIEKLFKEKNVALYEADWTKQDPIITEELAKFGRNSVPVYIFYSPGKAEAKILPQLLTPSIIEGLFQ
jgi:thiol:disulfide interchange protein DsbD